MTADCKHQSARMHTEAKTGEAHGVVGPCGAEKTGRNGQNPKTKVKDTPHSSQSKLPFWKLFPGVSPHVSVGEHAVTLNNPDQSRQTLR